MADTADTYEEPIPIPPPPGGGGGDDPVPLPPPGDGGGGGVGDEPFDTTCRLITSMAGFWLEPYTGGPQVPMPGAWVYEVFGFGARGDVIGTSASLTPLQLAGYSTLETPVGRPVEARWGLAIKLAPFGYSGLAGDNYVLYPWYPQSPITDGVWMAYQWWRVLGAKIQAVTPRARHVQWWDAEESETWYHHAPIEEIVDGIEWMMQSAGNTMPKTVTQYLTRIPVAHVPETNGAKLVTLKDADGSVSTCHNPLTANVIGDGTGEIEITVNGSTTIAAATAGQAASLRILPDQRFPYPATGAVDHGDGTTQPWNVVVDGEVWNGSKVWSEAGTYRVYAVQETAWGDVRSNVVTVHVAPPTLNDGTVLTVNGAVGTVKVTAGEAADLSVTPNSSYGSAPYSGTVYHGDTTDQTWSSADGSAWTGSKTWTTEGVYQAYADLDQGSSDPIAGNTVVVIVEPAVTDDPPSVSWVEPSDGGTISRKAKLEVQATDDRGIDRVELYADGVLLASIRQPYDGIDLYRYFWNTLPQANGQYVLKAVAYDTAGQTDEATILVSIGNDLVSGTKLWVSPLQQSSTQDLIRAMLLLVDYAPPSVPERTFRMDVTVNTPGTTLPTLSNLGGEYVLAPLRRRIDLEPKDPRFDWNPASGTANVTGGHVIYNDYSARVAIYLTPMLSYLEHKTAGDAVRAIVAIRPNSGRTNQFISGGWTTGSYGYDGVSTVTDGSSSMVPGEEVKDGDEDALKAWLTDEKYYSLVTAPGRNYIYRLSADNAWELMYDFGRAIEAWMRAQGPRRDAPYDDTYFGAYGAYTAQGFPLDGCLQDPEDWIATDMAAMGDRLVVAMNATDGSRGEALILDTTKFRLDPAKQADAYYLDADSMPYRIRLDPFAPLSINCVEAERPTIGAQQEAAQFAGFTGHLVGEELTAIAEDNLAAFTGTSGGGNKAWLGCSRATGGMLLEWDGERLQMITDQIEEITCLYSDIGWLQGESDGGTGLTGDPVLSLTGELENTVRQQLSMVGAGGSSFTNIYPATLWIGTRHGRVYRLDSTSNTLVLELETGDTEITCIRRFAFDMTDEELEDIYGIHDGDELNDDEARWAYSRVNAQKQGDGFLYVGAGPSGRVFRRTHAETPSEAWSEVRDFVQPPYPTHIGLWRSKFFSGATFWGGPDSTLLHRYDTIWARAHEFDTDKCTGLRCFVKDDVRRLFVGSEDSGVIWEAALADADMATEGIRAVGLVMLETGEVSDA
ncbi:MAG: hypothetical protein GF320_12825 [Armatimonadia bacterium]|nr:hypothetical protein [Armatimonadia bacterium]